MLLVKKQVLQLQFYQYRDFKVCVLLSFVPVGVCGCNFFVLYLSPGNAILRWLQVDSKENMAKSVLQYVMLFIHAHDIVYLSRLQKSLKFAIFSFRKSRFKYFVVYGTCTWYVHTCTYEMYHVRECDTTKWTWHAWCMTFWCFRWSNYFVTTL